MNLTRRERIRLLLASYGDVCDLPHIDRERTTTSKPGSRDLRRDNNPLWAAGSYAALERCLARIKERGYPSIHWHTVELYVRGDPDGKARRRKADHGLSLLAKWMPRNIYVPEEVASNANYGASDAHAAARPGSRRAA